METWYKAHIYLNKIEEMQVQSETEKTVVTIDGRKFHKETNDYKFCKTREEAKNHLISYFHLKIKRHKEILDSYELKLENDEILQFYKLEMQIAEKL